jgi:hypothetical protein
MESGSMGGEMARDENTGCVDGPVAGVRRVRRWYHLVPVVFASSVVVLGLGLLAMTHLVWSGGDTSVFESPGWSSAPALCSYREVPDAINQLVAGEVLEVPGSDAESTHVSALDRCEGLAGEVLVDPTRPAWVVHSGSDRGWVRLVDVVGNELVIEHEVGCTVTDEVRGDLVLVVQAPAGVDDLTATIKVAESRC